MNGSIGRLNLNASKLFLRVGDPSEIGYVHGGDIWAILGVYVHALVCVYMCVHTFWLNSGDILVPENI